LPAEFDKESGRLEACPTNTAGTRGCIGGPGLLARPESSKYVGGAVGLSS
jgi:hypothetical protein